MTAKTLMSEQVVGGSGDFLSSSLLIFWSEAGPARWFAKNQEFDKDFRARFLDAHLAAAARRLDAWSQEASSALALVILLDQFPRNAFRDTAHMYATDPLARLVSSAAIDRGFDSQVSNELRIFFYLPFEHSENLADQVRSLELHQRIGMMQYAEQHHDIIRRFGRFPHRNAVLCRVSTPEEQAFLDAGGFSG